MTNYIFVKGIGKVEVTEEVFKEYRRMEDRERYRDKQFNSMVRLDEEVANSEGELCRPLDLLESQEPSPEELIIKKETISKLYEGIATLSDFEKNLIVNVCLKGINLNRYSSIVHIPRSTLKDKLENVLLKLYQFFEENY